MADFNGAIEKLIRELGEDKVKSDDFFRAAYSSEGMAAFRTGMANGVLFPSSTEDVKKIIEIANEYQVPLIPCAGRLSGWRMIEVPEGGALLVEVLANMNRIIEIDEDNLSVTAEAGATVYQVDKELRRRGYRLPVHPVVQPGDIGMGSEVSKCSCGVYGSAIGPVDRWILGLKVVLGNGDLLETGASRMIGARHFQRYRLPDMTGLFMESEGALGIITEVTERIIPLPVGMKAVDIEFPVTEKGEENLMNAVQEIRKRDLAFDMYWATPSNQAWYERSIHYLNTLTKEEIDRIAPMRPFGDFPFERYKHLLLVWVESIVSEEEALARERAVIDIGKRYGGVRVHVEGEMAGFFDHPDNIWGWKGTFYHRGEYGHGQNWIYWAREYPMTGVAGILRKLEETFYQTKFPPSNFYSTAYFTPYGGMVLVYAHYYLEDPEEVKETLRWFELCEKAAEEYPELSIPWGIGKTTGRTYLRKRLKPYCDEYLNKIKTMFDPNGIMNPGASILR